MSDKDVIDNESQPQPEPAPGSRENEPAAPDAGVAAPISEKELAELKEKAEKGQQYYEQLLRMAADLENYKKRAARERQDAVKFANEALLEKFIPILDNFEMALAAASAPNTSVQSLQAGVGMIHQQLKSAMADAGLEEIDANGKPFDPNFHEALSQQETADAPEGHVVQQVRKGYKLRERLLRPASVIVAKKPAS
jgi:molecular chaperone GrpE